MIGKGVFIPLMMGEQVQMVITLPPSLWYLYHLQQQQQLQIINRWLRNQSLLGHNALMAGLTATTNLQQQDHRHQHFQEPNSAPRDTVSIIHHYDCKNVSLIDG
jgi:hypothetical protein